MTRTRARSERRFFISSLRAAIILLLVSSPAAKAHHAGSDSSDRIVLTMAEGHARPVMTLTTGSGENLHLYLDTGAGGNVISEKIASRLGLEEHGIQQVMNPTDGEVREARLVTIPHLQADRLSLSGSTFLALDLPQLSTLDGVLSIRALADHLVTIDFLRREIVLEHGQLTADEQDVMTFAPFPVMTVEATVAGHSLPMHLDTGSPDGITLPGELATRLGIDAEAAVVRTSGPMVVREARLGGTVEIGPVRLVDPVVNVVDQFKGFGNIGVGFLGQSLLTVDQTNRLVRIDIHRRWVDVGGYRIDSQVRGAGSPTVVFVSGGSAPQSYWGEIPRRLSAHATTVTFDRAGHGSSEDGPLPRTAARIADEMWRMLEQLGTPKPFVVVGHSLGTIPARVFAAEHAADVAGLLLLDPGHRDLLDGFAELLEGDERQQWTAFWSKTWAAYEQRTDATALEIQAVETSLEQQSRARLAQDLQLVVVSSDPAKPPAYTTWLSDASRRSFANHVSSFHQEIAELSGEGHRLVAESSGHIIPIDRPDLIISLIEELVRGSRQ